MLRYTVENMHFGLMRPGFAEAAVTQGRSLVSATDPGGVMTALETPPGSLASTRFQLACLFSFPLFNIYFYQLLPLTTSALQVGRQVNRWTC